MRSTALPIVLLGLAAIATACAGASSTDLFEPGASGGATTAGTTTTGGASGTTGGGTTGGATTGGATTSGATTGGNNGTTGGGATTGGGGTTGGGATTGGGGTTGGTTGGPVTTTYCGASTTSSGNLECTSPDLCCGEYAGSDVVLSCAASCNGGLEIQCSAASDCAVGTVCCGTLQNSKWTRIACAQSCNASGSGSGNDKLEMCDSTATPTGCPPTKPFCKASAQLKGFSYCNATP